MTKQEILQQFFDAWEALQSMPKAQGRPSMELVAARKQVEERANAVRNFIPSAATAPAAVNVDPSVAEYRGLITQIAELPPARPSRDGSFPSKNVTVLSG